MDHVKCKFCGNRHPMREPCKSRQLTVEELGGPTAVIIREVAQLHVPGPAEQDRQPEESAPSASGVQAPAAPPSVEQRMAQVASVTHGSAKFDRVAYQREYMRKWRERKKHGKS